MNSLALAEGISIAMEKLFNMHLKACSDPYKYRADDFRKRFSLDKSS